MRSSGLSTSSVVITLFLTLFLVLGVGWLYGNILTSDEYDRLEHTAVMVNATVTRVKEVRDDEGMDDYKQYISYTYQGILYRDVYYKTTGKSDVMGDRVTVYIDPENPGKLRPEAPGLLNHICACLIVGCTGYGLIYCLSSALTTSATRARWFTHYAGRVLSGDLVREDLLFEQSRMNALRYGMAIGFLAAALLGAGWYLAARGTTTAFAWFTPPALLILLVVHLRKAESIGQVELQELELTGFDQTSDDEGTVTKWLHFAGQAPLHLGNCTLVSLNGSQWVNLASPGANHTFYAFSDGKRFQRFFPANEFRIEKI